MFRMKLSRVATTALLVTVLGAMTTMAHAQGTEPTLQQRLERLTEELEIQRQELHIPGMAMAIVQGDELIYSHGCKIAHC